MVATHLANNTAAQNGVVANLPIKAGRAIYISGGGAIPPKYLNCDVNLTLYNRELVLLFQMPQPKENRVFRVGLRQISRIPDDKDERSDILTLFFINGLGWRDEIVLSFEGDEGPDLVVDWKQNVWNQAYEAVKEEHRRRSATNTTTTFI